MEDVGTFTVEWHMARDLKTLKCMLGCKRGANTFFTCIYCCPSKSEYIERGKASGKVAPTKATKSHAKGKKNVQPPSMSTTQNKDQTKPMQWVNDIMICNTNCPPKRD